MINWFYSFTEFTGRTGALQTGTGRTDALQAITAGEITARIIINS